MQRRKIYIRRSRSIHKKKITYLLSKFQWLLTLFCRLRPDLCSFYPQNKIEKLKFILWITSINSYKDSILKNDESFQLFLNTPLPGLELTPLQSLIYFSHFNIKSIYPLSTHRKDFINWFYNYGVKENNLYDLLSNNEKLLYKNTQQLIK